MTQLPTAAEAAAGVTQYDDWQVNTYLYDGRTETAYPRTVRLNFVYRGPDVPGEDLVACVNLPPGSPPIGG